MSVRSALLLLLMVAVLPSFLVQAGIYTYWFRTSETREMQANLELSRALANTIDSYIRDLAQHESTMGAAITTKWPYTDQELNDLLTAGAKDYPALNAFTLIAPDGRIIASSDPRLIGMQISDREHFQKASQSREFFLSNLLEGRADPNPVFMIARGVYNGDKLEGVISGSISPDRLGEAIPKFVRAEGGSLSIFDRKGNLVYRHPYPPLTWNDRVAESRDPLLLQGISGREAQGTYRRASENIDRIGAVTPVARLGWVAAAGKPRSAIAGPLMRSLYPIIAINVAVLLASLAAAWFISRGMTRSVASLRQQALKIGDGQLLQVTPSGKIRELADLSHAFNQMVAMRQKADEVIKESQSRLQQLAENVREVFWLGSADWNDVLYINPAYEALWGRSRESLYENPRSWMDAVVPEDKPALIAALGGVFGREVKVLPEYRITTPDGTLRWILSRAWPILDERGEIYRVAGIAEDITLRKTAEEAEAKYRTLVEESLVGVYLIQDDQFLYVNPYMARVFGYEPHEIEGRHAVMDLVTQNDHPMVREALRRHETGGITTAHYEFRGLRKDGRVIDVEIIGSGTVYNGRPAVIGTLMDITERKRTDLQLELTAAELARSNRDLEQFAYVASHDLQEPLRMISGHLQVICNHLAAKLDSETRESMTFAIDGAQRMHAMIQDLLAYSRVGRVIKGFSETDLERSLAVTIGDLGSSIEETGAVITHDPLPKVMAETPLINLLLMNLLGNAIKYHAPDRKPVVHVSARREEHGWLFGVEDNGIGIHPGLDRIFMVFQRLHTRQEYPGNGIGLAICKRIVEYHCGRIWVDSTPGEGSTFYFTIPDRNGSLDSESPSGSGNLAGGEAGNTPDTQRSTP